MALCLSSPPWGLGDGAEGAGEESRAAEGPPGCAGEGGGAGGRRRVGAPPAGETDLPVADLPVSGEEAAARHGPDGDDLVEALRVVLHAEAGGDVGDHCPRQVAELVEHLTLAGWLEMLQEAAGEDEVVGLGDDG